MAEVFKPSIPYPIWWVLRCRRVGLSFVLGLCEYTTLALLDEPSDESFGCTIHRFSFTPTIISAIYGKRNHPQKCDTNLELIQNKSHRRYSSPSLIT